jgi:DNA-binding NarL/FixJ family response regulator
MTAVLEGAAGDLPGRSDESAGAAPLRLLLVDDHPAVRRGLRGLLEDQPGFAVVASVESAEEAMLIAPRTRLDLAVVDYELGGRNGLWLSRKLKRLNDPPRVLIYSAYSDRLLAAAAVAAEADGLVSKSGLGSNLTDAIRRVADGQLVLPVVPWELSEVIRRRLDDQEQAIYGMRVAGIPLAEIAQMLDTPLPEMQAALAEMLRKLEPLAFERTAW